MTKEIVYQGLFVFAALVVIVSLNVGFFFLNSLLIVAIAGIGTWFLRPHLVRFSIPYHIVILALLMAVIVSFPTILRGTTASADATQTIILRVLTDHIPSTFAPYSNLHLNYQFSYHLFVKVFADIIPILPDYLYLWIIAVVLAALDVFSLYFCTLTLTSNNRAATWAVVLLFGTKAIFRDVLVGGYHTILAINFLLLAFTYFMKKSRLQYLFYPAAVAVHPHIGAFSIILFVVYVSVFRERLRDLPKLIPTLLLIVPAILTTYLALFLGVVVADDGLQPTFSLSAYFFILIPLFIGIVPSLACVYGFLHVIRIRPWTRELMFTFSLLGSVILTYIILGLLQFDFLGKVFELGIVAALFFSGLTLSMTRLPRWTLVAALIICVVVVMSSEELNHYRYEGKATDEEIAFAYALGEFDPTLQTVFLFADPAAATKIAEYGNKIPYDAEIEWFLPHDKKQVFQDDGLAELNRKHDESLDIIKSSCGPCAAQLNVTYIIVDRHMYTITGIGIPVYSYGVFDVYEKPF